MNHIKLIMPGLLVAALIPLGSLTAKAGEWGDPPDRAVNATAERLRHLPPNEILRYFAHPYPLAREGAALALAAQGESVLPLVERLASDDDPAARSGAAYTLTRMIPRAKRGQKPIELSAAMQHTLEVVVAAAEKSRSQPDPALNDLALALPRDTPLVHRIAIRLADSDSPTMRHEALMLTKERIRDKRVTAQVVYAVLKHPAGNVARHYATSGKLAVSSIDESRICLPLIAEYLDQEAHSVRGMFSHSGMILYSKVVAHHAEQEAALDSIPGLVKCYVRMPETDYAGWVVAKDSCYAAIETLGKRGVSRLRQSLATEPAVMAQLSDKEIARLETTREAVATRFKDLHSLAQRLAEP